MAGSNLVTLSGVKAVTFFPGNMCDRIKPIKELTLHRDRNHRNNSILLSFCHSMKVFLSNYHFFRKASVKSRRKARLWGNRDIQTNNLMHAHDDIFHSSCHVSIIFWILSGEFPYFDILGWLYLKAWSSYESQIIYFIPEWAHGKNGTF